MKKKITILIISIVAVLIIAAGIVMLFVWLHPASNQATTQVSTPAQAIDQLKKHPLDSLRSGYAANTPTDTIIYTKSGSATYAVGITPNVTYRYTADTLGGTDKSTNVRSDAQTFFGTIGLTRSAENQQYNQTANVYDTFQNDTVICQLSILTTNPYANHRYDFSCADRSLVTNEYARLNPLIDLYKKDHALKTFQLATVVTKSEANKSYSIVTLSGIPTSDPSTVVSSMLLFASVDGSNEFIGELQPQTTGKGTYEFTAEVAAKLKQAKYGTFLTDNIK